MEASTPILSCIGRYRLDVVLGEGSTGVVYRAHDTELNRSIAIKVLRADLLDKPQSQATFLEEARMLAGLDHRGIIPVFDVGQLADGCYFLVGKLVEGGDLRGRLNAGRPSRADAVELTAQLAEALAYAHAHGLIHRDVKPGNILLDPAGHPVLVDFGFALREQDFGTGPTFVGTIPYMSPEQARREGHRVDRRTDIFSLGVIFFEMLIGRRPFVSESKTELLELIRTQEAPPLRPIDDSVPPELERICLKALANRISDRYVTAAAMAGDLRHWQASVAERPGGAGRTGDVADSRLATRLAPVVVPRGLRSYGAEDADFFLDLLPGPRTREGLPERLAAWLARLDSRAEEESFRVGLLYGPSGCGKSSLVKAGIVPRLAAHVTAVYLEATPDHTENGLLRTLRDRFPGLSPDLDLVGTMHALRCGRGLPGDGKALVILDQFEQWLHSARAAGERTLVEALRQCDGVHVQCLLLVRDEFWLAVSRFLRDLEVPLIEGRNAALVDLFDMAHARKVLTAYGRAFGQLPALAEITRPQQAFIEQAVAGLADKGRVVPIQLSLFAEMVKGRAWTPATLRAFGGARGLGVAFLEETFGAGAAAAPMRRHAHAARAVLKSLLPDAADTIRGRLRSHHELLAASGYSADAAAFADLLSILDKQLRLVTPADLSESEAAHAGDGPCYQLTHDFLVPAVRAWVEQRQRESWRGRAELRLQERSRAWNLRPEPRQLPAWWEWANIVMFSRRQTWSEPQQRMMQAATRRHGSRSAIWSILLVLVVTGGVWLRRRLDDERSSSRADVLLAWIKTPHDSQLEQRVSELRLYERWVVPKLRAVIEDPGATADERLHARLVLYAFDPSEFDAIRAALPTARPADVPEIRRVLADRRDEVVPDLWRQVQDPACDAQVRLRLAGALATLDPEDKRWLQIRETIDEELVQINVLFLPDWLEVFRPVREDILAGLRRFALEGNHMELAVDIAARYGGDYVAFLTRVHAQIDNRLWPRVWPIYAPYGAKAIAEIDIDLARDLPDPPNQIARRHARLGVARLRLGAPDRTWLMLRHTPEPRTRSYLVHFFAQLDVEPAVLYERYLKEDDVSARRALLWALGEYRLDRFPAAGRDAMLAALKKDLADDPDSGIHTSVEWLLRRWKVDADVSPASASPRGQRRWYVNEGGDTMLILPPSPGLRSDAATPQTAAIASKEVSVQQFLRLLPKTEYKRGVCPSPDGPIIGVSWFQAARYCRLLSEREGIPEDEMCFPPVDQIKPGMKLPDNYLERIGYRLPTEREWEYACRAGATTLRYYGDANDLLANYGWYADNSREQAHPCGLLKPNDFGLFDTLGNTMEWCDDWYVPDPKRMPTAEELTRYRDRYLAKVLHGGELSGTASELVPTARAWEPADHENHHFTGLRIARTVRESSRRD